MRENVSNGFSQLDCCPMKGAGCSNIVNVPAVAADDGALAGLYHREQGNFIRTPIEEYAAFAAMLGAQDACFHQRTKDFRHVRRRLTQPERDTARRRRSRLLILRQAEKRTSCQK
jgi:hypothetical protein